MWSFFSAIVALIFTVHPVYVYSQQETPVTLSVTAQDHYTETPLDSVYLEFFKDGVLADSAMIGPDGTGVLVVTITRVSVMDGIPSTFSLSVNYPNPFRDEKIGTAAIR